MKTSYQKAMYALLVLLLLSRFLFIGRDLPNRCIGWYTLMDSFYYTSNSFDLYQNGTYTPKDISFIPVREGFEVFQKLFTYLSFLLFGNNFTGFLFPTVFLSLLIIILSGYSFRKVNPSNTLLNAFLILYLSTDFYFLLTSRVQTPVIYSVFGIALTVYLFLLYVEDKKKNKSLLSFLLGLVCFGTVLFIYVYTIFVFAALCLTLFILQIFQRKQYKHFLLFIAGILSSLFLYNVLMLPLANITLVDLLKCFAAQGGNGTIHNGSLSTLEGINGLASIKSIALKLFLPAAAIFDTNFFRFNLSLLAVFLLLFPFTVINIIRTRLKDSVSLFFVLVFIFCYLQAMTGSFYYQRKLVMLLPFVLLLIANTWGRGMPVELLRKRKYFRYGFLLYSIITLLICVYFFWLTTSSFYGQNISVEAGGPNTGRLFNYFNIGMCLSVYLFVLVVILCLRFPPRSIVIAFFSLTLLPGLWLSSSYIYSNPTYYYQNALLEINKKIKNKKVGGGNSYQFSLYNDFIPTHDWSNYGNGPVYDSVINNLCKKNMLDYTMRYYYQKKDNIHEGDTLLKKENYSIVVERTLPLTEWAYGPKVYLAKCIY